MHRLSAMNFPHYKKKKWFSFLFLFSIADYGIFTIKIKMFDRALETLTDVRHVLDLRKKLVSLVAFDSLGYSYPTKDRNMKISSSAMVIVKGEKIGNLYELIGSTVTSRVAVTTPEEFSSADTVSFALFVDSRDMYHTFRMLSPTNVNESNSWTSVASKEVESTGKKKKEFSVKFPERFELRKGVIVRT